VANPVSHSTTANKLV
jgi:hypothetical protein